MGTQVYIAVQLTQEIIDWTETFAEEPQLVKLFQKLKLTVS